MDYPARKARSDRFRGRFGSDHPTVRQLKDRIAKLEQSGGKGSTHKLEQLREELRHTWNGRD